MASTTWIWGDTHFGEAHAIELFQRPFVDAAAMDAQLVDAVNRVVKKRDVLIHIGDFCGPVAGDSEAQVAHAQKIRADIRCKTIQLVRGNHDPKSDDFCSLFDSVKDQMTFRRENGEERVNLCHYPLRSWRGQLGGAMHLYGHAHGALEEMGRSMDVGIDCWNYAPVRLNYVLDELAGRAVLPPSGWVRRQFMRHETDAPDHKPQS